MDWNYQRRDRFWIAIRRKHVVALAFLIAVSVVFKWSVWQQTPQIFNDTPGYIVPAIGVLTGRGYGAQENGFRTPTFPIFLALILAPLDHTSLNNCTDAHRAVCIGQAANDAGGKLALRVIVLANILFGLGITLLLYTIGWQLTGSTAVAILFGAGYAWNVTTAYWEISLLTESITGFLLLLSLYLALWARPGTRTNVALGIILALLALCHPLFLLYWILPAGYLMAGYWRERRLRLLRFVAPVLLIPLASLAAWSTFNYFVNGEWTPSTVSGYVLIQTVMPVIQNAPQGYDGITQTLVGYRDAQIRQTGNATGAVFRAWRDMMNATGLTFSQVANKLTALSMYLMWNYPLAYVQSVGESWRRFWDFAFYHYNPVPLGPASFAAQFANRQLQNGLNILFWISSLFVVGMALLQTRSRHAVMSTQTLAFLALLVVTVWFAAVFSSLTNLGDNARYRVTVMPLQYATITAAGWLFGIRFRAAATIQD